MIPPTRRVGTFTTDTHLVVTMWDARLAQMTGLGKAEACGRPLADLVPDLDGRGLRERFARVLADGVVEILAPASHHYLFPCPLPQPSRHFRLMQQRVTVVPLREGERIVGALVAVEDITERRERELAERLGSPDEALRLRAVQVLAEEAEVVPALAGALGDASWRVRKAAVAAVVEHGEPELIEALVHALHVEHRDLGTLNSTLQILSLIHADVTRLLTGLLCSTDADLRIYVALALGERGDRSAVGDLLALLDDPDANVRHHAVEALGKLRAGRAAERLIALARGDDELLAFAALDALARIGAAVPVDTLLPHLSNPFLAEPAVDLLGRLGDLAAVTPLAHALEDEHIPVVAGARALAALFAHEAECYGDGSLVVEAARRALTAAGVCRLLTALDAAHEADAPAIARVLTWHGGSAVVQALAAHLGRPGVAEIVAESAARGGQAEADALIAALASPDEARVLAAASVLGRLKAVRAVPALTALLEREGETAIVAAGALAQIGALEPFEALLALLARPDAAVRQAAVGALTALGHPHTARRTVALLQHEDPHIREAAVQIVGQYGEPACGAALLACSNDPDERVRRAAVAQLPFVDNPAALTSLARALRSATPGVRAAAARAFAHVAAERAAAPLLAALDDDDAWTRYYAAHALGQLGIAAAVDPLLRLAEADPAPQVRLSALGALGAIRPPDAAGRIAPLAASEDLELARAALTALGAIGGSAAEPPLAAALLARDPARRIAVLEALAKRADRSDIGMLCQVARAERDQAVRAAVVAALSAFAPDGTAAAGLVELAADSTLRPAVVSALVAGGEPWAAVAAAGLTHDDPCVRRAMVEAVARSRWPAAAEALRAALADPDQTVRATAETALRRLVGI